MVSRLPRLYIRLFLLSALFVAIPTRAGNDTARFYGTWQAIFPFNGQMVTMRTTHDENGYTNVIVTNMGEQPAGNGTFQAAKWEVHDECAISKQCGRIPLGWK